MDDHLNLKDRRKTSIMLKLIINEFDPQLVDNLIACHNISPRDWVVSQVGQIEYQVTPLEDAKKETRIFGESTNYKIFQIVEPEEESFAKKIFRRWLSVHRPYLLPRIDHIWETTLVKRAICEFEEGSHLMFQLIPMVFQTFLQNKLNAKHGEYTMQKANDMIYKNNKQFQCLHLDDHLPGVPIGEHTEGIIKFYCTDNPVEKQKFLEQVDRIYCCSEKSLFLQKDQFLTNFVRLFHYEYTRVLEISHIDLLLLFIIIMGEIAWIYKGMINRQSICNYYNENPVISLILGGSISFFKNFATRNETRVYNFDGPTVNKLLHKNIQCHEKYNQYLFIKRV